MYTTLRKLSHLFTPRERVQAGLILAGSVVGAFLEMVGVGAVPAFVATLTNPGALRSHPAAQPFIEALGITTDVDLVRAIGTALLVVFVVKNIFLAGLTWLSTRFGFTLQVSLADRLFSAYVTSPYGLHLTRGSPELLRNTTGDAFAVVNSALMPSLSIILESLTLAAILALLLVVEPVTSLVAFAILGGTTALFLRLIRRRVSRLGHEEREHRVRMITAITEGLGGIKITKILGRERHFQQQFRQAADGFSKAAQVRAVLNELPRLLLETIAVGGLLGLAVLLLARGREMESLVPTLTLLSVAVVRLIPSFNRITAAQTSIRWGEACLNGVYDDLVGLRESTVESDGSPISFRESIRLDGVTLSYPNTTSPALQDIDIEIRKGQAVGLVGPTGSGKTTLVDVLLGLLPPTRGRVLIDGQDIVGRERSWQRHVGYIPQDIYLSDTTIRENIAFGVARDEIDDEAVWRAVDAAQVREFVERLPDGIETVVGERGVRLSGGQRQRIGIARSLYHDPEVLVMDEATSALDTETEQYVMAAIEHLKGSRTLVLIAHRLTTVESCDRLYLLRDGQVEAQGTFTELRDLSASFRKLAQGVGGPA